MRKKHDHAFVGPISGDREVPIASGAIALPAAAQILSGYISGSLALKAEAPHNFSKTAAFHNRHRLFNT